MTDVTPLLHPVEIGSLRPTQITVGLKEVARKRQQWREHIERDGPEFLGRHMVPVVIGPKHRPWLIDHHHLALALYEEGVTHVLIQPVADLSGLKRDAFLTFMDNRNWLHVYDAKGVRQAVARLPKHVKHLKDDPFRSLAGQLRRAGGFAKVATPYSEFLWADFLRRRLKDVEALDDALVLARSREASFLPGWTGPES